MEIKYFRLIKTIEEEGSIANSADKLFLTQSALSHQLKELEQRLGFKVFYRKRHGWQLTDEGRELYQLGTVILEQLERGLHNIEQIRAGSAGRLRLSTECYSFYHGLAPFIQKMGVLYPNIHIDLRIEATHQPIAKLLSHDIDLALVTAPPKDAALHHIKLYEDEIFALMHREHPLHALEFLTPEAVANAHLIIHSLPLETVSVYTQFLQPKGLRPTQLTAIPLTEIALELVAANMGITCLPKWALRPFHHSEELVLKPLGPRGLRRTHYLAIRQADRHKHYINDFIGNFQETFSKP